MRLFGHQNVVELQNKAALELGHRYGDCNVVKL